jgi:sulfatase maturation enzyme AslB (radical SAM superfamily)
MCYAGASSQRLVFDLKHGAQSKYQMNDVDKDFFDVLQDVKILGFTGGETILQPEVIRLIDFLIEQGLSTNMIITVLTNASDFPDELVERFKKFRRVLYTVSIDGTGDVIEYQRRGADWSKVQENVIRIHHSLVHEIINHVVTACNVLNAMDFVDWCHTNDLKFVSVSHVFQPHLGVAALPEELKIIALERLRQGRMRYQHYLEPGYTNYESNYVHTIDRLISTLTNIEFDAKALARFVDHIKRENTASKKPLHAVVPEWAPWFVN